MNHRIAVVGTACRYPDAASHEQLWENVLAQRRSFRRIPPERLRIDDYCDDPAVAPLLKNVHAALLTDYRFDPSKFGVRNRSFASADLSHWMALDIASEALADSGLLDSPDAPRADTAVVVANTLLSEIGRSHIVGGYSKPIGRILASAMRSHGLCAEGIAEVVSHAERAIRARCPVPNEESLAGGLANVIAGRISAHFGFRGGNCTVDGACASSLIAVADGCRRLALGEAEAVVVGAVDISLDAFEIVGFALAGALARGPMRVYDERASGFWPGEGCGFVVLMREDDAVRRGVRIHAVIRGWGHSSDGTPAITRPESDGQLLAIQRAYRNADFGPASVDLYEGHGTGTEVGDAVEIEAIERFRASHGARQAAVLGSIKSNIGHTKAAAGMAGLLKTVAAVRDGVLPPSAHAPVPAAGLRAPECGLSVLSSPAKWEREGPRRAGVSSFGFGGTNVHVLLEQPAKTHSRFVAIPVLPAPQVGYELFLLQARGAHFLLPQVDRLLQIAGRLSFGELGDLAAELSRRLNVLGTARAAIVASTPDELHAKLAVLRSWLTEGVESRLESTRGIFLRAGEHPGKIAFMFPGQGTLPREASEWPARFREAWVSPTAGPKAGEDNTDTEFAQPSIVAAQLSGLRLLRSLGIEADAAIGHSLGELTALCWAGAFDEGALLRIAEARGAAMSGACHEPGGMIGLEFPPSEAERLAEQAGLVVACMNAPRETILAGPIDRIERAHAIAESRGIRAHRLRVSHAFHSPLMAPSAPALAECLRQEGVGRPLRPVYSSVTGGSPGDDVRKVLIDQLTNPVRFNEALGEMFAQIKPDLAVEVGPGRVLSGLASRIGETPCVAMDVTGPLEPTLQAVGALFALGRCPNPQAFFADRAGHAFDLENWNPRFILNPFASIPADEGEARSAVAESERFAEPGAVLGSRPKSAESPLEIVSRLIAEKLAEDSAGMAVRPDSALMTDLKLTSREAAEVADRAAAALGVSGFRSTGVGLFTVAQLADALQSKMRQADPPPSPKGLAPWVRALRMVEVETPQPSPGPLAAVPATVVRLEKRPDETDLQALLQAAKQAKERFAIVQFGPWASALAKCLFLELGLPTCVVEIDREDPDGPARAEREIAAAQGFVSCRYAKDGTRFEPRIELFRPSAGPAPYESDALVLVTGGAKGIGAECVLEIGARCGCRFVLLGRSSPDDKEVAANLDRFERAGIRCRYLQADIGSPESCRSVAEAVGGVTDILHCAGANAKALISEETPEGLSAAWAAKVTSAENLFRTFQGPALRSFVGFGSIIGTVGFQGSGAYATANEALRRLIEQWSHPQSKTQPQTQTPIPTQTPTQTQTQTQTPTPTPTQTPTPTPTPTPTRLLCIEWSVWADAGMGAKMHAIETMAQMGIEAIPVREGVRALLDIVSAMRAGQTPPSLIVSGRLPDLPTCKWRLPHAEPARFHENERIFRPGIELVCEPLLSVHTDPYLRDHALGDTLVFPAVMGMEAAVQVARRLLDRSDLPTIRNARFHTLIEIPKGGSHALRIAALAEGAAVKVAIRCASTGFALDHFTFECDFEPSNVTADRPASTSVFLDGSSHPVRGPQGESLPLSIAEDLYAALLFHGPMFRAVHGYTALQAHGCEAHLHPTVSQWFGQAVPQTLALGSPGLNDAAIHALQACIPDTRILPVGLASFCVHRTEAAAGMAARQTGDDGSVLTFDVRAYSSAGELCAEWIGLELKRVEPLGVRRWPAPLAACVLQRRLDGFLTGFQIELQSAEERPLTVRHAPNGKPEARVSRSRAGDLTLTVSGKDGVVACDIEPVSPLADIHFDDGQIGLIDLLRSMAGDSPAARTRVWCARECLSKAGYAQPPHLAIREVRPNGVLLAAGTAEIFTTLIGVSQSQSELCAAILRDGEEALSHPRDVSNHRKNRARQAARIEGAE